MGKPIIAVDIDDVLANSSEALRLEVNRRLGVKLLREHYQIPGDYKGHQEMVWRQHGLEERISMDELEPFIVANQSHVPPYDAAYQTLKVLAERYELIIITARPSSWRLATEQWVADHFPGLFGKVLFADGSEGLKLKTKGQLCVENNATWLIDDNVEHAQSAHDRGVEVIVFGTYGWHHAVPDHFVRCKDWAAVAEYFDGRG